MVESCLHVSWVSWCVELFLVGISLLDFLGGVLMYLGIPKPSIDQNRFVFADGTNFHYLLSEVSYNPTVAV